MGIATNREFVHKTLLACVGAVTLSLATSRTAHADDYVWTGGSGNISFYNPDPNLWSKVVWNGSAWVPSSTEHGVPSMQDTILVDGSTPTLSVGQTVAGIKLGTTATASLLVNGGTYENCTMATLGSATTDGNLTVDGQHTLLVATNMYVDGSQLDVTNGGRLSIGRIYMSQTRGTNFTVNGAGSTLTISGGLNDRYTGYGSILVTNGGNANIGTITEGLPASVVVDGAGSKLNGDVNTNALRIDHGATFTGQSLNVTNPFYPQVTPSYAYITNGSTAAVSSRFYISGSGDAVCNVSGRGTTVTVGDRTTLGFGSGPTVKSNLSINSGARLETKDLSIYYYSTLYVGLDLNSKVVVDGGTGDIFSPGKVRLTAGTRVAIGDYTPIESANFRQAGPSVGSVFAVGGKWDFDKNQVHVNYTKTANAGDTISFDLMDTQRVRFTDTGTGKTLGISFLGSDVSKTLTVSAELVADPASSGLTSILASGDNGTYIDAWAIHPTAGYTQGDDAYLSIEVGANYDISTFKVWHYDGTYWTSYAPDDLSYDGLYAGFTVNGFSSYALSGGPSMSTSAVPEPASLGLIGLAGLGLLRRKRIA